MKMRISVKDILVKPSQNVSTNFNPGGKGTDIFYFIAII